MEPANEPLPSDRLQPEARMRGGFLHGCVQAWLSRSPAPDEEARLSDALLRPRPLPVLEAAARLATALEPGVTVLVRRLLDRTGSLRIRPVETQVWAGFLEIGVATDDAGQERPCDTTLIYDRPSGTWHMEP